MLRYITSGESHGKCLTSIIDGIPANVSLNIDEINLEMKKRQSGYGRGGRMKIESDTVDILSGVRGKTTIGGPIAIQIKNKDYENWIKYMNPVEDIDRETRKVEQVRPGHADLIGSLKYNFDDARNVLERSSARETASRVAVGAICKQVLKTFGIEFASHVVQIGNTKVDKIYSFDFIKDNVDISEVRCIDKDIEELMISEIDMAKSEKDTLGGIIEIRVKNVPPGLGSYVHYDKKIDAHIAMNVMSIQAIKGVEIGIGFDVANNRGSNVMDEIFYNDEKGIYRESNRLGGIEGGMTTGDEIVVRCAMKPIPTLYKPLNSINMKTLESFQATVERSDTCAVPACSVVCENVVAFVILQFMLDKFGKDNIGDVMNNYNSYMNRLGDRGWKNL
ncbi:chorismate synthase [[Clostridium] bifermentans ATCC 638]|uniref:Chorismate synthase n=1 Tax=Paraclostridium bifermentans ATCC 638 = DSM 14991 TaxID=1233171 RepID=T4VT75_PARBF|nr:chorismate synthase [Paraclostridium bifermentans]EQK43907.1 chorismate synthase [[Clostridium] bifermentans ATCC 638] [Paraclostridium bifermentans ATCC 638 = DSM 14991]RIZ59401.1 chorismate synthase [Paraclostridium bifermentans]UAG17731.1 chorismate synthase [Paraclostridium bifermentans]